MAAFAMLVGTRRASAVEHNRGLVLVIAFESMFKLVAMLALRAFVWFGLDALPEAPPPISQQTTDGFAPLVLLGALAMFILPHQFHDGVVECRDAGDVRTARWQFPRSEEHTSELQSLMRISYAIFCLKKKHRC